MGGRKHLEIAVPKHRNSDLRRKTKNLLSLNNNNNNNKNNNNNNKS